MNILILSFLFAFSRSKQIKGRPRLFEDCSLPDGYNNIADNSELNENSKLYSCQQDFKNRIDFKNCVLTIVSCSFLNIELSDIVYGIININIDVNNYPADLNGNIEIQNTTFNLCNGGCIYFTSNDATKSIDIKKCVFKECKIYGQASAIYIHASSGEINDCKFINNEASYFNSGVIFYDQMDVGNDDLKLKIINNQFEHKEQYTNGLLTFIKDNCKLEFSNNSIKFDDSKEINTKVFRAGEDVSQIQGWIYTNNCMDPLNKDMIINLNGNEVQSLIDSFIECPPMECPPIPDPNSGLYINNCESEYDDSTQNQKDKLVAFYYCKFKNIENFDKKPGGAIYISTSVNINIDIKLPFKIYNCEFFNCKSSKGGAIAIESTETSRLFEIKDCTFTYNNCQKNSSDTFSDENYGGCIYIDAKLCSFLIAYCIFETNSAGNGGGIAYITDSLSSSKSILETETEIEYSLKIQECSFTRNKGLNNGGAIYISLINGDPLKTIEIIKCQFTENSADEFDLNPDYDYEILPESGGAIYFLYNPKSSLSANFALVLKDCNFEGNYCSHLGGSICLLLMNNEPSNPIEINHCKFDMSRAENYDEFDGIGSDIYYSYNISSATSSKTLLENNPSLNIIDCEFTNGYAITQGNSLYFTVQDVQQAKSIEVIKCTFKKDEQSTSDDRAHLINAVSNRPNILFHFSECKFSGKCTTYFNAVSGYVESCTFNDVIGVNAIYYDCNPDVSSNENQFKIEYCEFIQLNEIASLVFFVPKSTSKFGFSHNTINISNSVTRVFDCDSSATNSGVWQFNNNTIIPAKEEFIKTQNAINIQFEASCENGFICELPENICPGEVRCEKDGNDIIDFTCIYILNTTFTGLTHPTNGGAVEIINMGIICNKTVFNGCKSEQGGGAIYIYTDKELTDPISLKSNEFEGCEAVYGGAIYIYSSEIKNTIEIVQCKFTSNVASKIQADDELYGGAAIYMRTLNGNVISCKFSKNIGTGVKFNKVIKSKLLAVNDQSSSIIVDNCEFETSDGSTSSSIYYVHSDKNDVKVDVKDCTFKGQLHKNTYHIDGTSLVKNNVTPRLKIKSCKFSSNIKSSLNLNSNLVELDEKMQEINVNNSKKNESHNNYNWKLISGLTMIIVGITIIAAIIIIIKSI